MPAAIGIAVAGMALTACHVFDIFGKTPAGGVSLAWLVPGDAAATPGFDGSTVFYLGSDHYVYALDAASGHERWRSTTGTDNPSPLFGNCAVAGGVTVCGDGGIVAFRRDDGGRVWRFDAPPDSPGHFPVVVLNNNTVVGGSWGFGTIYAIDAATGALRWTAPVLRSDSNGVNITRLAGDSDIVVGTFVRGGRPETGGVIAVDAGSGNVRWVRNFPLAAPDSACAGLEVALWRDLVLASSSDGRIYRLARVDGTIQGFFSGVGQVAPGNGISGPVGQDLRPITVSGTRVFAASTSAWFVAYDLVTDQELWRVRQPDGSSWGSDIVADQGAVYVMNGNGFLTSFSTTDGKVLLNAGSPRYFLLSTSVAVSNDLVFGAGDSGFWAIRKP